MLEHNEVLRAIVEKNQRHIIRNHSEEIGTSPTTISGHLKLIAKIKNMNKWVLHELNENYKRKRFEISFDLFRYQNVPFLN